MNRFLLLLIFFMGFSLLAETEAANDGQIVGTWLAEDVITHAYPRMEVNVTGVWREDSWEIYYFADDSLSYMPLSGIGVWEDPAPDQEIILTQHEFFWEDEWQPVDLEFLITDTFYANYTFIDETHILVKFGVRPGQYLFFWEMEKQLDSTDTLR